MVILIPGVYRKPNSSTRDMTVCRVDRIEGKGWYYWGSERPGYLGNDIQLWYLENHLRINGFERVER